MPDVLSIQLGGGSVVQKNVSILSVSIIFLAKILISNFRDCWANNIRSCCVRVGSGIQTDATTLNNSGNCSASWEGYNL